MIGCFEELTERACQIKNLAASRNDVFHNGHCCKVRQEKRVWQFALSIWPNLFLRNSTAKCQRPYCCACPFTTNASGNVFPALVVTFATSTSKPSAFWYTRGTSPFSAGTRLHGEG